MAILKFKKLIEDLQNGSVQVLSAVGKASSAAYAGTGYLSASASNAGYATTASRAGTSAFASSAGGGTGGTAGVNL